MRKFIVTALMSLLAATAWAQPRTSAPVEVVSAAPSGSCTSNAVKLVKKSDAEGGDLYACLGGQWRRMPVGAAEMAATNSASLGACVAVDTNDITRFEYVPCGGSASVSDLPYSGSWDGLTATAPSKNAVYDKIQQLQPLDEDLSDIAVLSCTTNGHVLTWNSATSDWECQPMSAGVSDGDKGGVIVTNSGATWTLATNSVGTAAFDAPTLEGEMEGVIDLGDLQSRDIDSLSGQGNINTAFVFDGADVDFETGSSDAYPRLLNAAAPTGAGCTGADSTQYGRLAFDTNDDTDGTVVVCTSSGWKDIDDDGGSGGFTDFTAAGDTGTPQIITDGNTLTLTGGTGVDTVASAADVVTFNADLSEVAAGGVLGGQMDSPTLNNDTVTAAKIVDGTIIQDDINSTQTIGADPANGDHSVWFGTTGLIFEGATSNTLEGLLTAADPTSSAVDKTWVLPDVSGTIVTTGDTGSVTSNMISDGTIAAGDLVNNTLTATQIGTGAVGTDEIANNVITAADLADALDLSGETSLEIPNSSTHTVTTFGQIAGDDNYYTTSPNRGAALFHDGQAVTVLVGALASSTPSNGKVPTWNTGGTVTWETPVGTGQVTALGDCTVPGECFTTAGTGTLLRSDTDLIMELDDDNNSGTPESFQVKSGADAIVAEIDETGVLTLAQQATGSTVDFFEGSGQENNTRTLAVPTSLTGNRTCTFLATDNDRFVPNSCLELIESGDIADATIATGDLADGAVTPDKVLLAGQTDELCLTYEGTGDTWEWQACGSGGGDNVQVAGTPATDANFVATNGDVTFALNTTPAVDEISAVVNNLAIQPSDLDSTSGLNGSTGQVPIKASGDQITWTDALTVTTATEGEGDLLFHNGTTWVNSTDDPATGEVPKYNTTTHLLTWESDNGTNNVLDLGNDGGTPESANLATIATTGDTPGIFTEPTADKLLIDVSKSWPVAADLSCTDCIGATEVGALALGSDVTGNYAASATPGGDATGVACAGSCISNSEVDNDITASNYLPLAGGASMTAEYTIDALGVEFEPGDALTDCSTFSATGGGIFFDDSENTFKKCENNTLSDLDTGGGATILDDLTDVIITAAANKDVLMHNGSNWVDTPSVTVTETGVANDHTLVYDTDGYVNKALPSTGTNGCAGASDMLQYNTTTHAWACGSAAGSGDITAAGPGYAAGSAFTDDVASTGSTMFIWEGTTVNTNELSIIAPSADPGADINITLPAATGTLYATGNTDVAVADGGTGLSAGTSGGILGYTADGTLASSAALGAGNIVIGGGAGAVPTSLAAGATTTILVGGGAGIAPVWTTAEGTGAPVRAGSPTLTTPNLGTPSAAVLTNATNLPFSAVVSATNTAAALTFGTGSSIVWNTAADGTAAMTGTDTLAGSPQLAANAVTIGTTGIIFEGATGGAGNAFEGLLTPTDPTADRTWTLPDVDGTIITTGATTGVTSTMITDGTITGDDVNANIGGTGIDLNAASPDVLDFDATELSTVTFGSSNFGNLIFDPSGTTNPTFAFSDNSVVVTNAATFDFVSNSISTADLATEVRSMYWDAGAMSTDGTNCTAPAEVTIASGPKTWTVNCPTDSSSAFIYGKTQMPDSWDGGVVRFTASSVNTNATPSGTYILTFAAQCRTPGTDTIDSTWTGTQTSTVTFATQNRPVAGSTADLTPVGSTCSGGDMLFWRAISNTGTTTQEATVYVLGVKMEYTSNVGDQ